jgi:hypothetical protein
LITYNQTRRIGSKLETFSFESHAITTTDSLNNKTLALESPAFNSELDIEIFSSLQLKKGFSTYLNLYHPGGASPPYYCEVRVERTEQLKLPNGRKLDCWVLFTDYGGIQPSWFWFTIGTQNFIKMEADFQGNRLIKARVF